jgi:signal transduction histidine kinase
VRLAIAEREGQVILTVEDDGIGFDVNRVKGKGSLGLVSIEERARLVGGRFVIDSQPGKGTRVEVRIPLRPAED